MDGTITQKLEKELRRIFDDDEFVLCILTHFGTDEQRKNCLKIINDNPDITSEELTLMSISEYRKGLD